MRVRDPRVPSTPSPRPPEVARIRALLAPGPPGLLDGKTFDEVRALIGEPLLDDGTLHQALLDEGLEVETS